MFLEAKTRETPTVDGPQTYCFPEVSVNKYFIIYRVSKEKKSTTNQSNMYKKDYLLPDMAP